MHHVAVSLALVVSIRPIITTSQSLSSRTPCSLCYHLSFTYSLLFSSTLPFWDCLSDYSRLHHTSCRKLPVEDDLGLLITSLLLAFESYHHYFVLHIRPPHFASCLFLFSGAWPSLCRIIKSEDQQIPSFPSAQINIPSWVDVNCPRLDHNGLLRRLLSGLRQANEWNTFLLSSLSVGRVRSFAVILGAYITNIYTTWELEPRSGQKCLPTTTSFRLLLLPTYQGNSIAHDADHTINSCISAD
jgi:hypothetical protein